MKAKPIKRHHNNYLEQLDINKICWLAENIMANNYNVMPMPISNVIIFESL